MEQKNEMERRAEALRRMVCRETAVDFIPNSYDTSKNVNL